MAAITSEEDVPLLLKRSIESELENRGFRIGAHRAQVAVELRIVTDPQRGIDTVSDNFRHLIVGMQNGAFVKRFPRAANHEAISLPVLFQFIRQLLQQSTNHS